MSFRPNASTTRTALVGCALLAGMLLAGVPARADIIDYAISGLGSGSLNGGAFSNQTFTITLVGNTSLETTFPGSNFPEIDPLNSASIDLGSLGTAVFTDPTRLGVNTNLSVVFFSQSLAIGGGDLFDFFYPGFPGLGPTSPLTFSSADVFALGQFPFEDTTLGPLVLDQVSGTLTYQAVDTSASVPEPASLALLGCGLLGIAALRHRRKRATVAPGQAGS